MDNEKAGATNSIFSRDYLAAVAVIEKEFNEYKNRENRRVAQLKITIPNDLNDIYNKVSNLGKE